MLKFQPREKTERELAVAQALAVKLQSQHREGHAPQELRMSGHTCYSAEYAVDLLTGGILAEYLTGLAYAHSTPLTWMTHEKAVASCAVDLESAKSPQAVLELLSNWLTSAEPSTDEDWNSLKRALDEDRLSDRKLFDE